MSTSAYSMHAKAPVINDAKASRSTKVSVVFVAIVGLVVLGAVLAAGIIGVHAYGSELAGGIHSVLDSEKSLTIQP